ATSTRRCGRSGRGGASGMESESELARSLPSPSTTRKRVPTTDRRCAETGARVLFAWNITPPPKPSSIAAAVPLQSVGRCSERKKQGRERIEQAAALNFFDAQHS